MDATSLAIFVLVQLVGLSVIAWWLTRLTQSNAKRLEEITLRRFARLEEGVALPLSDAMFEQLRGATFAILDVDGHPVCCAFFVTECGIALTAAHEAGKWAGSARAVRASTYRGEEFTLSVIQRKVAANIDVAVLRLNVPTTGPPLPTRSFLPLPRGVFTPVELQGKPVVLVHGSIAWSAGVRASTLAQNKGYIVTTDDITIHYDVSTYKGHSGAALLLRGEAVVGLHSNGFNDLPQELSEASPSTSADAVRLDLPQLREAVERAKLRAGPVGDVASAGALRPRPGGARRRAGAGSGHALRRGSS
jgi:hypothetical protein